MLQTPDKKGWFWYIPQHDDIVSVGVVGAVRLPVQGPRQDYEKIYDEEVERAPAVKQRIATARRA